jgi:hypothetical protein
VLRASFDIEPASNPMPINGIMTPKPKTRRIGIKYSERKITEDEKKKGARHGSRK